VKERGILFRGELVRKILAGEKDVTRRVIRPDWSRCLDLADEDDRARAEAASPYGVAGDRLWVRETWTDLGIGCRDANDVIYRSDDEDLLPRGRHWKPSIHMPRWASRVDLEIVSVRAERLQEITVEDIIREGLSTRFREHDACVHLREQWVELWNKTNAHRGFSWESNPWVWRIEFKRIEKAEAA
jgi:hypothetical protein